MSKKYSKRLKNTGDQDEPFPFSMRGYQVRPNLDSITFRLRLPDKQQVEIIEQYGSTPSIDFSGRDLQPLSLQGWEFTRDLKYQPIESELQQVLTHGRLGGFIPIPIERQKITSILGFSRKIFLVHSLYPHDLFVISGIGVVGIENNTLRITPPNREVCMNDVVPHDSMWMHHAAIDMQTGLPTRSASMEPLGGYAADSLAKKIRNTQIAQSMLGASDIVLPALIAWGGYQETQTGFVIYRIPQTFVTPFELYQLDLHAYERFGHATLSYDWSCHAILQAMRRMHVKGIGHFQLQGENCGMCIENASYLPVFTDWTTAEALDQYSDNPRLGHDGYSARQHAVFQDTRLATQSMTLGVRMWSYSDPNTFNPVELYPLIFAFLGYQGKKVTDQTFNEAARLYEQILNTVRIMYPDEDIFGLTQQFFIEAAVKQAYGWK